MGLVIPQKIICQVAASFIELQSSGCSCRSTSGMVWKITNPTGNSTKGITTIKEKEPVSRLYWCLKG